MRSTNGSQHILYSAKEIWKDRVKAVSVFKDLAPEMERERILLILALLPFLYHPEVIVV